MLYMRVHSHQSGSSDEIIVVPFSTQHSSTVTSLLACQSRVRLNQLEDACYTNGPISLLLAGSFTSTQNTPVLLTYFQAALLSNYEIRARTDS